MRPARQLLPEISHICEIIMHFSRFCEIILGFFRAFVKLLCIFPPFSVCNLYSVWVWFWWFVVLAWVAWLGWLGRPGCCLGLGGCFCWRFWVFGLWLWLCRSCLGVLRFIRLHVALVMLQRDYVTLSPHSSPLPDLSVLRLGAPSLAPAGGKTVCVCVCTCLHVRMRACLCVYMCVFVLASLHGCV